MAPRKRRTRSTYLVCSMYVFTRYTTIEDERVKAKNKK